MGFFRRLVQRLPRDFGISSQAFLILKPTLRGSYQADSTWRDQENQIRSDKVNYLSYGLT